MKTMRRMSIPVALMTLSLFGGNGSDSTGEYWEDESGVKHYYLFLNSLSNGTYWGGASYGYTRAGAQAATGSQPWIDGSVWVFERDTPHTGWSSFGGARQCYGLIIERPSLTDSFRMEGGCVMTFGALGIHSDVGDTNLRFYHNGSAAKIVLAESQTWSGPVAGTLSSAPFVIVPNYPYSGAYSNRVAAAEDVVWTIKGDTFMALHTYTNELDSADVVVKAPAIVSIPQHWFGLGRLGARTLTIDSGTGIYFGANLSFNPGTLGSGTWGIGSYPLISPEQVARTIELKNGATLTALKISKSLVQFWKSNSSTNQFSRPVQTTAYVGLATIWAWPFAEEVAKTSAVICTLLGALLGISTAEYNRNNYPEFVEDDDDEEEEE